MPEQRTSARSVKTHAPCPQGHKRLERKSARLRPPPPDGSDFSHAHYVALLVWLYSEKCPEKLPDVSLDLERMQGKERQMLRILGFKHGIPLPSLLEKLRQIRAAERRDPDVHGAVVARAAARALRPGCGVRRCFEISTVQPGSEAAAVAPAACGFALQLPADVNNMMFAEHNKN